MDEFLIARYYVREAYTATPEQDEAGDPRINEHGDIEYKCQYNIVKRSEQYIVNDTVFDCASYSSLENLMSHMGLRDDDENIFWT